MNDREFGGGGGGGSSSWYVYALTTQSRLHPQSLSIRRAGADEWV